MSTGFNEIHITKSDFKSYWNQAIDYSSYKENMAQDLVVNPDLKIQDYIKINQQRMHRVEKTYVMSEEIQEQIRVLHHKTFWLVLTEHWCGDAAQALPVLHQLASFSKEKIELKLLYRDKNEALIDAFLTNGTRSIPKLMQLNEHFNLTGIWGPRPSIAQSLVKALKSNPDTASNYANELHLWYAKDKQQAIEKEISKLIIKANQFCPDCLS